MLVQIILRCGQARFSSRELFATLEYLPPTRNLTETPSIFKRIFSGTKDVAKSLGYETVGALSAFVADIIPSQDERGAKWYLHKFDFPVDSTMKENIYGIEWHISRRLIQEIGSRLVGRLGIVFIDGPIQNQDHQGKNEAILMCGRVGVKLVPERGRWYDFSMLPSWNSEELILKINPIGKSEP